jgi:hypothetical protein
MTLAVRPKTSDIVKYQLPAQYQSAEKLAAFLKYYYEWTEQDGNAAQFLGDMIAMKDIDLCSDEFVERLLVQMIKFVPRSAAIDRKFLAKHVRDFFDAKGSLVSYEFIMQALFGEEMTKHWMGDYVLKASESDFGYQTIIPISITSEADMNEVKGSFLKGPNGQQSKIRDVIKTVAASGKEIQLVLLDNASTKGTFTPNMSVKALKNNIPTTYYEVLHYYTPYPSAEAVYYTPQTTETEAVIVLSSPSWNFAAYNGLIVRMVGGTFRAVVKEASTVEVFTNKVITLTLERDSVTGTITGTDFYLISSFLEDTHYNKSAYVTGDTDYAVTGVIHGNHGSLYYEGLPIKVALGSGQELDPYVSTVGTGGVSSVLVTKYGKGYVVGDEIQTDNRDSGGDGFAAEVSNIDGVGADVRCILELDHVVIRDGGTGFEPGDMFEFTYDDGRNAAVAPIRLTVATVQSAVSRTLNGIRIDNVGYGYQYAKVALSSNGGAPIAGFTINAKIYPDSNPLFEPTFYSSTTDANLIEFIKHQGAPSFQTVKYPSNFTNSVVTRSFNLPTGAIYDIVPSATTTVPAGTITVNVNGYGAAVTPNLTAGTITSVTVNAGGYNYVDPVVKIIGGGYGAVLYAVKDTNGTITSVTVSKGGTGYTGLLTVYITERYGAGFSASPLIGETSAKGAITSFNALSLRGEYTTLPQVQKLIQNSAYNPSYLRYIPDPGGSAPYGENAILDFEFRVKRLELKSGGFLYNKNFEFIVPGGTGGRVLVATNNSGQVSGVTILSAGSGYANSTITITPSPTAGYNGPGGGATFNTTVSAGKIQTAVVAAAGSGYYPTNITFSGCHGSGAEFDMIVSGGELAYVRIVDPGASYSSGTTISFSGSTASVVPTATLVVEQGKIVGATITNAGSGITNLVYAVSVPGTMETAHPVINGNGGVKNTIVMINGKNYYAADEVVPLVPTVSAPVSGVTATVLPVLDDSGTITGMIITNPGSGYTVAPTISVAGGYVVGGVQPTLPSFTVGIFDGRVVSIEIGGGGDPGFMYGTRIIVSGTGSGAAISPVIDTGISRVVVTAGGNYTPNAEVDVAVSDSGIATALPGIVLDPAVVTIMTNADGDIYDVIIKKKGSHHITPTINMASIPGLTGSGGTLVFFVDRPITSATITSTGSLYTNASAVVVGDGSNALIDLVLDKTGVIESVVLDSAGTRLTRPPVVTVVDSSNYGAVSAIKITDPGSGYYKTPLVYLEEGTRIRGGINDWEYGGAELVTTSNSIGTLRSVDFNSFGYDYQELPKLTTPIVAIVDSSVGFKVGEVVRSKSYAYYAKDLIPHIGDVTGAGTTATIMFHTHPDQVTLDMMVTSTADLGIEVGMYLQCVSSDTAADGTFKIIAVEEKEFTIEFNGGISVTGPITLTEAQINSEFFGPHGILQYVDSGRKLLVISSATEKYSVVSETGDVIVAENGISLETEDSYDMNEAVTYLGATTGASATPIFLNRAYVQPMVGAVGVTEKKFQSDRGRINTKAIRMGDNNKYQDYAYVITTGIQLGDYKSSLDSTVHPAGFKMFGELAIQKTVTLPAPSVFSSQFDSFISLFFTLNPSSIESSYQDQNNALDRRYFQRFAWSGNDIATYDFAYNLLDTPIEDYDYSIYNVDGKYRNATEAAIIELSGSVTTTYVHDNTAAAPGTTIRVTKNTHGITAGQLVTIMISGVETETAEATNVSANAFDLASAYTRNTSGNALIYVADEIETAYATDRKEQGYYDLEFMTQPVSAVSGGYSHAWTSGYRFDIGEPYPHPETVTANLMTITFKEVDLVTAEERLVDPRLGNNDVVWLKNLVSDTTDFSNGTLITQAYQPYPIFSRTTNSVTVFLSSPEITGTKTGKIDVRFNAPFINK